MTAAQAGDLALLISPDHKRFVVLLEPGESYHTHRGVIAHNDVIGSSLGGTVASHNGALFRLLRPSMEEVLMTLSRSTQIVYPKDIGYILLKLSVVPGMRVIEAGSGSGVLTTALARYVSPGGQVYSYEARPEMLELARSNVERVGLGDAVTFSQRSIEIGFDEREVDALFLDVREPWLYLDQALEAMADGAFFGALVPTVNQVVSLVRGLHRRGLGDIEVGELMLRKYKAVPERVRPLDRMTAHTGFLLFARKMGGPQPVPAAEGDEESVLAVEAAEEPVPAAADDEESGPTDEGGVSAPDEESGVTAPDDYETGAADFITEVPGLDEL